MAFSLKDVANRRTVVKTPNTKDDRKQVEVELESTLNSALTGGRGKTAKIGATFEKELEETIHVYESLNIAYIQKFFPKTTFIPPRFDPKTKQMKKGFMMYTKKTGFDYIGGIIDTNQPIFIEAKTTTEGRIPVYDERVGIKAHQLEKMSWMENNTSFVVFFLWQVRSAGGVVYKFTPNQLIEATEGKKSLSIVDCEERRFTKMLKEKFGSLMLYDFLYKLEGYKE